MPWEMRKQPQPSDEARMCSFANTCQAQSTGFRCNHVSSLRSLAFYLITKGKTLPATVCFLAYTNAVHHEMSALRASFRVRRLALRFTRVLLQRVGIAQAAWRCPVQLPSATSKSW